MLWQRLLTAAVGIPIALLLVYLGSWYLAAAVALLAIVGLREFYRLMARRGRYAYPWLGYPLAVSLMGLLVAASLGAGVPVDNVIPWRSELAAVSSAFVVLAIWMLLPARSSREPSILATLAGHLYVPQLLSYLLRLRTLDVPPIALAGVDLTLPAGLCWVGLVMVVCWSMDTAAYAVGKTLGRRKLCPTISPGKTVEGAAAGLLAAVLLTAGLGAWLGLPIRQGLILGLALGVAGQLGDLLESVLKRRAGVKDSGTILPGHGGVLDRFDSLLFSAPVAYYYLCYALGI